MPPKGWNDLSREEQIEALSHINSQNIGSGPGRWSLTSLISRIVSLGLQHDPQVIDHLIQEGIKLPPTFTSTKEKK